MKKYIIFAFLALATMFVQASEGSPRLLILQANTHGNDNGGAGGFATSLVELFNNTNAAIDLDAGNYFLHIGNATQWTNAIQLRGVIPAQSSFLIASNNPQNATPRAALPEPDQTATFSLVNSGFRVAVLRGISSLSVNNPFMDAGLAPHYVDMLGVEGSSAFETQAAQQSRPQGPRRTSLVDTDNNHADFSQADFRGELLGNNRTPDNRLYRIWPRNSSQPWNPITGLPAIHPEPYPHLGETVETPTIEDAIAAGATGTLPVIFISNLRDSDGNPTIHHSSTGRWTSMSFAMIDPNNPENTIETLVNQEIRGRGNTTWIQSKRPYRIRFRNNQQQSPFGLSQARNWVLLANYFDPSLTRTSFAFELGYRLGLKCTPSFHHVEVIMDGDFIGSYVFTEHRQADPDGRENVRGRPLVESNNGGWFVGIDERFDTSAIGGDPGFRTVNFDLPILVRSPEFAEFPNNGVIPTDVDNFVRNDWEELTRLVASESFPENGYRELIDIDSWIKYFHVQILTNNADFNTETYDTRAHPLSIFAHRKNADSPIKVGPLWDFDLSFGCFFDMEPNELRADKLPYPTYSFFARFFQDPIFRVRHKEIWNENRYVISNDMTAFIDDMEAKLATSAMADNERWGRDQNRFANEIARMRQYFNERFAFLDETYNLVNVLPASHSFDTTKPEIPPQTFTLVAYGEMLDLDAVLQNAHTSAFEIVSILTQTPTGSGGYLATISVALRREPWEIHRDTLILSGINQGDSFLLRIPLGIIDVADIENAPLQAFPNPVSDRLHIVRDWQSSGEEVLVELFSMSGRRVFSQRVYGGASTFTIDVSSLPSGVYFLRVGNRVAKIVRQ